MKKTVIYYEDGIRKEKTWKVRGHRNTAGLHVQPEAESIVFCTLPNIHVTASFYTED